MKKISTYLPSLIISVLLVFLTLAGSAMLLVDINISAEKLKKLAQKNSLETSITRISTIRQESLLRFIWTR